MAGVDQFIYKLKLLGDFTPQQIEIARQTPVTVREQDSGDVIVREGDKPTYCCIVLEGYLIEHKTTSDGTRQIVALQVTGDMPDVQCLHLKTLDRTLSSSGRSMTALINHDDMHSLIAKVPTIGYALWRETLIQASIYREWVLNMGARDAPARVAHLLCEVLARLQAMGRATENSFELPLKQRDIADASGLSLVHVNKTIQKLRAEEVLRWEKTTVEILDPPRLAEIGDFSTSYLHLRRNETAFGHPC